MANGVVYSTAGSRRMIVALDAGTGELLWVYRLDEGERGAAAPRQLSGRGLAYWTDGDEERIVYVTPGYRLVALDARTGRLVPGFGQGGMVDLKRENDQNIDLVTGEVGLHAAPVVAGDVVIVGAAHRTGGNPRSRRNVKGYVRGYDVRTGRRLWIFHTIPAPGEFGRETWLNDSAVYTGNTGVWAQISVDEELEHRSTCRWRPPPGTTTAATAPAPTCSPRAWWRSTCTPASASGTSSSCTTASGTTTSPARRS